MNVKDSVAYGTVRFSNTKLILSGPMAFLSVSFATNAPTSCIAIERTLNESVVLILSSQNFFNGGEISVISSIIACKIKYGVCQGQKMAIERIRTAFDFSCLCFVSGFVYNSIHCTP